MGQDAAKGILDLFAKQIIHRPLGHAEFDAAYAKLREELFGPEPTAQEVVDGAVGTAEIVELTEADRLNEAPNTND